MVMPRKARTGAPAVKPAVVRARADPDTGVLDGIQREVRHAARMESFEFDGQRSSGRRFGLAAFRGARVGFCAITPRKSGGLGVGGATARDPLALPCATEHCIDRRSAPVSAA
jgi:hypothetical protein